MRISGNDYQLLRKCMEDSVERALSEQRRAQSPEERAFYSDVIKGKQDLLARLPQKAEKVEVPGLDIEEDEEE